MPYNKTIDKSIWYKSYKYEDDLTVGDVYYNMSDNRKTALKEILWHIVKHTRPDATRLNYLIDCFQTFNENEKLAFYYLANEAITNGETVFDKISWFSLLRGMQNENQTF